jgi:hypothetical protein
MAAVLLLPGDEVGRKAGIDRWFKRLQQFFHGTL